MEEHRYPLAQYWRFRAEFLLECWQATAQSIEDLLEGNTLASGRRPFVLVYRNGVELWSRPQQILRFRDDEAATAKGVSERHPSTP
jgi:hypothetical protein